MSIGKTNGGNQLFNSIYNSKGKKNEALLKSRDAKKKTAEAKKPAEQKTEKKTDFLEIAATKNKKATELSDAAKTYLDNLKSKYSNVDFFVAEFEEGDNTSRYTSGSKAEFSCVITPSLLEKMASDSETAKKYEDIIEGAGGQLKQMIEDLGEQKEQIANYGITVSEESGVNYYALLKDGLPTNNFGNNSGKTEKVTASSVEELLKKIKEIGEKRAEAAKQAEESEEEAVEKPEESETPNPEDAKLDINA